MIKEATINTNYPVIELREEEHKEIMRFEPNGDIYIRGKK